MSKVVTSIAVLPPYFHTSILQKALLAGSGSLLIAFTFFHLLGSLLLVLGDRDSFNLYAATLNSSPLLHLALELVLLAALIVHIFFAITIARRNRQAKPQNYIASPWWRSLADRAMLYTGPLILVFLCVHLQNFRFGSIERYHIEILDRPLTDWHRLAADTFGRPTYASFYIAMMMPLGIHLRHGLKSAGQSLGLVSNPWLERGSWLLSAMLAIGFAAIPAWIFAHK